MILVLVFCRVLLGGVFLSVARHSGSNTEDPTLSPGKLVIQVGLANEHFYRILSEGPGRQAGISCPQDAPSLVRHRSAKNAPNGAVGGSALSPGPVCVALAGQLVKDVHDQVRATSELRALKCGSSVAAGAGAGGRTTSRRARAGSTLSV